MCAYRGEELCSLGRTLGILRPGALSCTMTVSDMDNRCTLCSDVMNDTGLRECSQEENPLNETIGAPLCCACQAITRISPPRRQTALQKRLYDLAVAHDMPISLQDLCRRCYAATSPGKGKDGCSPLGSRRHHFVQAEACAEHANWQPAAPPLSRRNGSANEVQPPSRDILSLQVRPV